MRAIGMQVVPSEREREREREMHDEREREVAGAICHTLPWPSATLLCSSQLLPARPQGNMSIRAKPGTHLPLLMRLRLFTPLRPLADTFIHIQTHHRGFRVRLQEQGGFRGRSALG